MGRGKKCVKLKTFHDLDSSKWPNENENHLGFNFTVLEYGFYLVEIQT